MSEDYTQTNNCIEQIKKRHESSFNLDYISDVGFLLSHIHTLEKEIDRLREGLIYAINELEHSGLCFDHPTIVKLQKLLKEGKDESCDRKIFGL